MVLSDKTKSFGFRQIETCLVAFMQDFEKEIHDILPNVPVFVLWSGDNNLYMNTKFNSVNSELYEQNPRVVVRFNTFEEDSNVRTQKYNPYTYKSMDKDNTGLYRANIRRLLLYIEAEATLVSSNLIDALSYLEICYGIATREHAFTYQYQGSVFQGAYSIDQSIDFTLPESDSGTRNFASKIPLKVQCHLFVPNIKTINTEESQRVKETRIDITSRGISENQEDIIKVLPYGIETNDGENNKINLNNNDDLIYDDETLYKTGEKPYTESLDVSESRTEINYPYIK